MARTTPKDQDSSSDQDLMTMKVRRQTWKVLKALAGWKEINLADYIDELCLGRANVREDLKLMQSEVTDMNKAIDKGGFAGK